MALAWLSSSRQRMGSKLAARTKALMSSVMALYHEVMWLVLPQPENGGRICKKRLKDSMEIIIG